MDTETLNTSPENKSAPSPRWVSDDHRKQVAWQIVTPLAVGVLLMIALAVLIIFSSSSQYDLSLHWANISLIAMILLAALAGFVFLIILVALIYALARLLEVTPIYTKIGQFHFFRAAIFIITWADKVLKPIFLIQGASAGSKNLLARLTNRSQRT